MYKLISVNIYKTISFLINKQFHFTFNDLIIYSYDVLKHYYSMRSFIVTCYYLLLQIVQHSDFYYAFLVHLLFLLTFLSFHFLNLQNTLINHLNFMLMSSISYFLSCGLIGSAHDQDCFHPQCLLYLENKVLRHQFGLSYMHDRGIILRHRVHFLSEFLAYVIIVPNQRSF